MPQGQSFAGCRKLHKYQGVPTGNHGGLAPLGLCTRSHSGCGQRAGFYSPPASSLGEKGVQLRATVGLFQHPPILVCGTYLLPLHKLFIDLIRLKIHTFLREATQGLPCEWLMWLFFLRAWLPDRVQLASSGCFGERFVAQAAPRSFNSTSTHSTSSRMAAPPENVNVT